MTDEINLEETTAEEVVKPTIPEPVIRPPFQLLEGVNVVPTNIIVMSPDIVNALNKCYPNQETDLTDGMSAIVGGTLYDSELAMHRDLTGDFSNIIYGISKDNVLRKAAISAAKPILNGSKLAGEEAVLAITSVLGLNGRIDGPLVNSGFRVQMRRMTGDERVVLDEQLLSSKGDFGRLTYGSSMSFSASYLQRDIIDSILRTVTKHNLDGVGQKDIDGLRKRISKRDYPTLILMALTGTNPDGLHTNVPCSSEDVNCNHISNGKTNPARMLIVDHSKLTDEQLEVITRPISEPVSLTEQEAYVAAFIKGDNSYEFVKGDNTYRFEFKIPNLYEDTQSGVIWANNVNKIVNRFISGSDSANIRRRVIKKQIQLNTLAQFAGWIASLKVINDLGECLLEVEDTQTIIATLKEIYTEDGVLDVLDSIRNFIFKDCPVVIGVPVFLCPNCKQPMKHTNTIVPVDIEKLFFIRSIDLELIQYHLELLELTQ